MADFVKMSKSEYGISVLLFCEDDKPFKIGEEMYAANENAYMNGYNWEAFFQ